VKWTRIIIPIASLVGCAAPNLGPSRPQVVEESMKSRSELQQCLVAQLAWLGIPHIVESNQARVVMSFETSSSPVTLVINDLDHTPYEATRSVEIWKAAPRDDRLGRAATTCK
jgi:hypothetical protein